MIEKLRAAGEKRGWRHSSDAVELVDQVRLIVIAGSNREIREIPTIYISQRSLETLDAAEDFRRQPHNA